MRRRSPSLRLGRVLLVWAVLAIVLAAASWTVGPRPRTPLGWSLLVVLGPPLVLVPYALLVTFMEELSEFAVACWGRPRRRTSVDVRRVLLLVAALILTAIPLGGLVWLVTRPLGPFFAPVGTFLGRHFGSGG